MRHMVFFAILALFIAGMATRFADRLGEAKTVAPEPGQTTDVNPTPSAGDQRTLVVQRDRGGHFKIDGAVDGRRMAFLVDTGASVVALREGEAARLGIRPVPAEYTATVRTANGSVRAAPVTLRRVEIGWLRLTDVAALVLPDRALGENLLGMSFLSRLRRFEFANDRLVLEQ